MSDSNLTQSYAGAKMQSILAASFISHDRGHSYFSRSVLLDSYFSFSVKTTEIQVWGLLKPPWRLVYLKLVDEALCKLSKVNGMSVAHVPVIMSQHQASSLSKTDLHREVGFRGWSNGSGGHLSHPSN